MARPPLEENNANREQMPDIIEIIGGHTHLIDYESNSYPWLGKEAPRPKIFGPHEHKLFHNYWSTTTRPMSQASMLQSLFTSRPDGTLTIQQGKRTGLSPSTTKTVFPHAIVAFANLAADDVEAVIEAHRQSPKLRGIRHISNWKPTEAKSSFRVWVDRDYLTDGKWRRGFALLEKYGLSGIQ